MKICKDGRVWGQNNKEAGSHLGVTNPPHITKGGVRGNNNPMFGKHHKPETRMKMGHKGNKHWNWKNGVSSLQERIVKQAEFRLWREAVFARDNWTCQKCNKRGGRLHPHHIKAFSQYPELRFAIDNGITLCFECHKLTENYGGKANKNE